MQGRKRGKRKATATLVLDDPEHILLDRKVSCRTAGVQETSAAAFVALMGAAMLVPCTHHLRSALVGLGDTWQGEHCMCFACSCFKKLFHCEPCPGVPRVDSRQDASSNRAA